ncbi:MAG: carbohydrate porin [Chthoniobacterales bacterium]|nr:carbohydrate porin [Chthoniobacterales bacterium]
MHAPQMVLPRRIAIALLCLAAAARAETTNSSTGPLWQRWFAEDRALDTFVPARKKLSDDGLGFGGSYTTDLLGNPAGGQRQGFTYYGQLQLILAADLEKLIKWKDAYFVASMFDSAGNNLSRNYIGNYFNVTEVASIPTVVLGQMYFEQRFLDDKISLKIGRMGVGSDFVIMDIFNLYVGGIDGHTPVFVWNTFWSGAATSTWAGVLKVEPRKDWTLRLGVYQATTANRVIANHGLNMDFNPSDGVEIFGEAGWKTRLRDPWGDGEALPGEHKFGGYWSSWEYPEFGGGTGANTHGLYWIGQQMVWRERAKTDEGVTLWYSFVYAPTGNISRFPFFSGAGGGWQGALPGREEDWILFGSYFGTMSRDFAAKREAQGLGDPTYEWVLEWDYRAQLTPWLYVMPCAQWVINPGGTGRIPDALVLGAEIGVTF